MTMNSTTRTSTEIGHLRRTELGSWDSIPLGHNPVWVYLIRLAPESGRTMGSALQSIVKMTNRGADTLFRFTWPELRYHAWDGCHRFVRHAANSASLAFCISLAASVSLTPVACCCNIFALIPGFKYCCQSVIEAW
jgi:hypothetical protein